MPSRLPVTSGSVPNLRPSTPSSLRAQMVDGDHGVTREKLFATHLGVVRPPAGMEVSSDAGDSDLGNTPAGWENNVARKQLDMQWHYTCGPLRVSQHAGKNHWDRLHTTTTSVLPQPGGGLHVMTSSIPHETDSELSAKAAKIGASQRTLRKSQGLPPIAPSNNPPSTPLMRQHMRDTATRPLPRRLSTASAFTDGSSAFSRTTVAEGGVVVAASQAGVRGARSTAPSTLSRLSAASKRSEADTIRIDTERERTRQRDLADELKEAAERLAALERLLEA